MGKNYILSEENYMEVLERLQKISNKWKLLRKLEYYSVNNRTKKENYPKELKYFESKSWGYVDQYDDVNDDFYKEKYSESNFTYIKEHPSKQYDTYYNWAKEKKLIHIDLASLCVLSINVGDKVFFNKYGFIVISDDKEINNHEISKVYKNYFIIDRNNKILSLENEINNRVNEWNEDSLYVFEDYEYEEENNYDDDDYDDYDYYDYIY